MFSDIVFAENPQSAGANQLVVIKNPDALVALVEHLFEPAFKNVFRKPGVQHLQQRDDAVDL